MKRRVEQNKNIIMTLYGAIVSNVSAHVSMVTVIDLKWHDNYEFDFFLCHQPNQQDNPVRICDPQCFDPTCTVCTSLHVCNQYFAKACPLISVGGIMRTVSGVSNLLQDFPLNHARNIKYF